MEREASDDGMSNISSSISSENTENIHKKPKRGSGQAQGVGSVHEVL